MKISVIISTYNSPAWLEKVLIGYECQLDAGFEIVIADDGSGRETRELVSEFAAKSHLDIRHVWHDDDGFQKWRIVNHAIEESRGDYLVFTDGDCIPRSELIATHRARAARGRFLSGGYCKLPVATSQAIKPGHIRTGEAFRLGWLMRNGYPPNGKWLKIFARPLGIDDFLNRMTPAKRSFNGNNSSCWRSDAIKAGGFDERIRYGGGDREFGYRLSNAGIMPIVIRYSALCLHLNHSRSYKDPEIRKTNETIIADTISSGRIRTSAGIIPDTALFTNCETIH